MKTAYELLLTAPDGQVTRSQLAFKAIADGRWIDASYTLRNAAREESGEWANDALELAGHCEQVALFVPDSQ